MIHHSHVTCDECGEKHTPGAFMECIGQLQEQRESLLDDKLDLLAKVSDVRIQRNSEARTVHLLQVELAEAREQLAASERRVASTT